MKAAIAAVNSEHEPEMSSSDFEKASEPLDVEALLPSVSLEAPFETVQLDTLLPRLELASELLASAPETVLEPSLIFRGRDGQVHVKPIGFGICFGRAEECDICFPGLREISRHHFRIEPDDDQHFLTDDGSSNGTFVSGDKGRIRKHILRDGDIIEAAGFEFVFVKG